jgi:hypothetical protein
VTLLLLLAPMTLATTMASEATMEEQTATGHAATKACVLRLCST